MAAAAPALARRPPASATVAAPGLLRLAAFALLAFYGAAHWANLVEPAAGGAMVGMVAAACAAGAAMLALPDRTSLAVRAAVVVALLVALAALVFLTAGVPLDDLRPRNWDLLASGLSEGISSTPGVTVPYRGADPWTRTAVLIGGTALVALAACLAFWPRSGRAVGLHRTAALALTALYAIPVVQRGPDHPYLDGIAFSLLLAGYLWFEKLSADRMALAGVCLLVATLLGALVAPRLDAHAPWLDYESLAEKLEPTKAATFSWDHAYGPLHWPRDGREILRIKARTPAYWKADDLDDFDGTRWLDSGSGDPARADQVPRPQAWTQTITVMDRGLRSQSFVGAGITLSIDRGPHHVETAPGHFEALGRALAPGASWQAQVYAPRPTDDQLRRAPSPRLTGPVTRYLDVTLPTRREFEVTAPPRGVKVPAQRVDVRAAPFGTHAPDQVIWRNSVTLDPADAAAALRVTPYRPTVELADRLRRESSTPYDFVQRVRARVMENAVYDEHVRAGSLPLQRFLFEDRRGYCQHFSGAMALLLRLGGIPARVATGFSPGNFDSRRKAYIVQDTDAHSWVEAWFEGIGWVTFDPTPAASPARAQQDDAGPPRPGAGGGRPVPVPGQIGDRPLDPGEPGSGLAPPDGGGFDWRLPIAGVVVLGLVAFATVRLVRAGRLPGGPLAPELAELQRALHRSGRTPAPGTTLTALEQLLGDHRGRDGLGGYVDSLRRQRFAGTDARAPTGAERRALRRRLGDGLGLRGRVRAWWALPPRVHLPRR
jgi:transglutaminase-like putative cysteine protease